MRTSTQLLADFAVDTRFEDLPNDVTDYTKLLILDSLICGLGAAKMERTRMAHRFAERLGEQGESTVFGMPRKLSSLTAASANSEIMNLLDADDTFFNSAHFVILNVAAGLAEAERVQASGRELIRSVAVGFDVSARFNLASSFMTYEDGEFRWSRLFGSGYASLGAAVSGGIVSALPREQMANALALVAGTAPTARNSNTWERTEFASYKYAPNFHLAQSAMTALLMAEIGYIGEPDLVDLEPGFIQGQGFVGANLELLADQLGEQWWIRDSAVKYYPSCRYTHAPAHALGDYMREHGLRPDEIENIEVRLNPAAYSMTVFNTPAMSFEPLDHRSPMHAQFNIPYVLAQVALGRTPGARWYSEESLRDPEVWELARRITTAPDPSLDEEWDEQINNSREGRPRRTRASFTIRARGQEFSVESDYAPGDPWSDETRPTWERVTQKLHDFCGDMLATEQLDALVEQVRNLDRTENVAKELSPLLVVAQ